MHFRQQPPRRGIFEYTLIALAAVLLAFGAMLVFSDNDSATLGAVLDGWRATRGG